ncbi:MAG TPA: hypothetical protein DF712_02885, partial [Balneola sp.]|nr:hypothetical protein [Balneola sp.]
RLNRLGGGEEEKEEENIPTTGKIMKRILELGAKSKELTQIKGLVRGFLENEHTILSEYSDEIAIPLNNLLIRHYDLLEKEFGADDVVDSLLQLEDRGEDSMINQYVVKVLTKERAEREPAQKLKELGDDYLKAIGRLYEPVGYKSLVEQHRKLSLIRIANAGKALNENIKSLDTNKEHNTLQDLESTYSLIRNLKDLDTKLRNYPYKEAHKATKMYNQMLEQSM